jgi:secondary thiamine-phosphate synthase enzyme
MEKIQVRTPDRVALIDITHQIQQVVSTADFKDGLCFINIPHTTAAITINENADPDVERDIIMELNKIIPFQDNYRHMEGNSAAHIKSSLVGPTQTVIIEDGRLQLGTWQGIYLCEFDGPRTRQVWIKLI